MRTIYYFKKDVRTVTGYYYNIIIEALKQNGDMVMEAETHNATKGLSKDTYFLITTYDTFAYLYFRGYRNFIFWYQGLTPEEDCQRTKSKLRFEAFSFFERLSLKKSRYRICVSKYQVEFFNRKYRLNLTTENCFVMPCFNSEFNSGNFHIAGKYDKNVFCYSGGIQEYQGFDLIMQTYKEIEDRYPSAFLKVYTFDLEKANEMIPAYGIKNYSVERLAQKDVDAALAQCKFGFLIRDNNIINQVATPTKLTNYLGNGVIPIMTSTIKAYADIAKDYEHIYCYSDSDKANVIEKALSAIIKPGELESEYRNTMDKYFNAGKYIQQLTKFFKSI